MKNKTYKFQIINNNDGNDTFEVEAQTYDEAAHKALEELGWWVAENDEVEINEVHG